MTKYKILEIEKVREMLIGKHLSYKFSRYGHMSSFVVNAVDVFEGMLFNVMGKDKHGKPSCLLLSSNVIEHLYTHKECEVFTNSKVRPIYIKYVLGDCF